MQLEKITWPVYKLSMRIPEIKDNVIYYSSETINTENNQYNYSISVIDDKNIDKPTLGLRRLTIEKENLYNITTVIYTIQDLLKIAKPNLWFIDNNGQIFQYKKTTRAKLATYKIIQVLPVAGIGCVLEIEGFSERFKSMQVPKLESYAAVLSYSGKNLLYGLSTKIIKPSWRLV